MDHQGNWHHDVPSEERLKNDLLPDRGRYVISVAIGEQCRIEKSGGEMLCAVFEKADGNKITLKPIDSVNPGFLFSEKVRLTNLANVTIEAQVWDNRGGTIILRTLPIRD